MATIKRYDVTTPRPKYSGDGVWWHRVGSAVMNDKGQIMVYLDSVPVPDKEKGTINLVLFEPREKDDEQPSTASSGGGRQGGRSEQSRGGRGQKPTAREDMDDEIPF